MKHLLLASFNEFWLNWRGFFLTQIIGILIGFPIGYFIRFRTLGVFVSVILGCVGSYFCDSFFYPSFHVSKNDLTNEITACATGALVLCLAINLIFGSNKGRDRTPWRS